MKTKNKAVVLVEIAVVLCSMLLVATLPAITAASEDDFTLGIYGNANEDDTIDMRDTTYIKLAIFGKKPKTDLADANYDGKVSMLDVGQTKLIILGKEKELTIEDYAGEVVTINKPVERVVVYSHDPAFHEVIKALKAKEKIVGVDDRLKKDYALLFPELSKLPSCGGGHNGDVDYEAVLNLNPDFFLVDKDLLRDAAKEKMPHVTVFYQRPTLLSVYIHTVTKLGYILDKEEEAEEYINWREGWINKIKARTEGLTEDEKQQVVDLDIIWKGGCAFIKNTANHVLIDTAGGKNIAEDLVGGTVVPVDPEWIMTQNPDVILIHVWKWGTFGYSVDDPSEMKAAREEWMNRPEFANLKAVKNGDVYCHARDLVYGAGGGAVGTAYFAKWFYPDLFEDLDPQAIHQEYLDRFQGVDFNVYEHGVFVYPPLE